MKKLLTPEEVALKQQELELKKARLEYQKEQASKRETKDRIKQLQKEADEQKKKEATQKKAERVEAHRFAATQLPEGSIEACRQEVYAELIKRTPDGEALAKDIIKQFLMKHFHIVTIRSDKTPQVYIYNPENGLWEPNAIMRLKAVVEAILAAAYKPKIASDVLERIMLLTQDDINNVLRIEDPWKIACSNGVLNLRTQTLEPFAPYPRQFIAIPTAYNEQADTNLVDAYLDSCGLKPEDKKTVLEIGAWLLQRQYKIAKIVFFYGSGRNSKDTVLHLIEWSFGETNFSSKPIISLKEKFALSGIIDKLGNFTTETPQEIDMETMKSLSGGGLLTTAVKYGDDRTFSNYTKLVSATNEIPELSESNYATFSRMCVVHFPKRFVTKTEYDALKPEEKENVGIIDPLLEDKLRSQEYREAYLKLAVDAAKELFERGDFANHKPIAELQTLWELRANDVKNFWESAATQDDSYDKDGKPEAVCDKQYVYEQYSSYCLESLSTHAKSEVHFWRKINDIARLDKTNFGERIHPETKARIKVLKFFKINSNFWKTPVNEGGL